MKKNRDFKNDSYFIRFFRNGNWWRAYEFSAYLSFKFPNNEKNGKKLSVINKHYSCINDDLIYVGLQQKSFKKYFPYIKDIDLLFSNEKDFVDIDVSEYKEYFNENNSTNLFLDFCEWKKSFSFEEKNNNKDNDGFIGKILSKICDYDISNKTLIENTLFLNNIQLELKNSFNKAN